jgi:hypothetical protein
VLPQDAKGRRPQSLGLVAQLGPLGLFSGKHGAVGPGNLGLE